MLKKLVVKNYRCLKSRTVEFNSDINVVVGDNDVGKSTLLRAVELALTGRINGVTADQELSPHWFNRSVTEDYVSAVQSDSSAPLPEITIEAFLEESDDNVERIGSNNSLHEKSPGFRLRVSFDSTFAAEYAELVKTPEKIKSVPTEYFRLDHHDFAGERIFPRQKTVRLARIDASTGRHLSGTDWYLRQIIRDHLPAETRAGISLAFRTHREELARSEAFSSANKALAQSKNTLLSEKIELGVDTSSRASWERSVVPHLDDVPFADAGQGEQAAVRILLALDRSGGDKDVILVEEPENHLSFSRLNSLMKLIQERCDGQQLLLSTHSSFVLNRLGIDHLVLMSAERETRFSELGQDTRDYFAKLAGYDTLRLLLAKAVILVEGPSDEIIVQKAYLQAHECLPLEDGYDVISVQALAFARFLELGELLGTRIAIITDLDSDESDEKARKRFERFEKDDGMIRGFIGQIANGRTLEPQLVASAGLGDIAKALDLELDDRPTLLKYMEDHKTDVALKLFGYEGSLTMPQYIMDAIKHVRAK